MAFTVAVGSGVAIIPRGNTTGTPYTLLPPLILTSLRRTRRRNLHVVCAENSSPEPPRGSLTASPELSEPQYIFTHDREYYARLLEPDFWSGPQWDWLGFFIKYLWLLGFAFGAIAALYGCITYQDRPNFKEAATNNESESVQSSELFEEPEAYDSDVFESNPTEVAPSLE